MIRLHSVTSRQGGSERAGKKEDVDLVIYELAFSAMALATSSVESFPPIS